MKMHLKRNGISVLSYARINAPFIIFTGQGGQKPQLLSHHFVYVLLKNAGERTFHVRQVKTDQQTHEVMVIDRVNFALLENALLGEKSYSSQTVTHQKRRSAGQVCPLCRGPLTGQKSKKGKVENGKEYFEVRCHYRHYPHIQCEFLIKLEQSEYALFKKNRYPTRAWIKKLDGQRCPRCKDVLFERRLPNGNLFHQCRKTLVKEYPGEEGCDFKMKITNEEQRH